MQRGSSNWRHHYWGSPCRPTMRSVRLGRARLKVDHRVVKAVEALNEILVNRHGYDVHPAYPEGDTGAYNCRHIGNDSSRPWSSHAWATAIDVNWNQNPDGSRLRTNIPREAIDDIHRIRTKSGAPVWRWGGDWDRDPRTDHSYYDAMHFEIHATPAELATGVVVSGAPPPSPSPSERPTLRHGDRGAAVREAQELLGIRADGIFGPKTDAAVRSFQKEHGLDVDGVIGKNTWAALEEEAMPTPQEIAEAVWGHFIPNFVRKEDDPENLKMEAWRGVSWGHLDANTAVRLGRRILADINELEGGGATAQEILDELKARLDS